MARNVASEKKHWWVTNRKMVEKYIKEARNLIATEDSNDVAAAIHLLNAALALSPRLDMAMELKARSLLYLRRFKEIADLLQDYIPSLKVSTEESGVVSSDQLSRERVKLLPDSPSSESSSFKCFSVSDLKKKIMAGICRNGEKEGQWRYIVLGHACSHLGLMEDAIALLQTGKRLATAAFRLKSISLTDDSFFAAIFSDANADASETNPKAAETESVSHLIAHIKLLRRRRAAAVAALNAGLFSESIRHFSKILDGRRGAPQAFLAECYVLRAAAYRSAGRIVESIADCNKTLALEPSCIAALETRAALFETIRCFPDSLHDLEHLKLLYNTILRDKKLPGPPWKRHNVKYREIPGKLCVLTTKIKELKQKIAGGETGNVDYYSLMGVRRGCTRSELERAHLLLLLRHKPEKAMSFVERCDFSDQNDVDSIRDRAKMSSLSLFRLIQKGFSSVMGNIAEEEAAEKQRKKNTAAIEAQTRPKTPERKQTKTQEPNRLKIQNSIEIESGESRKLKCEELDRQSMGIWAEISAIRSEEEKSADSNVFQGVFCRDIAAVGNLLSRAGFNHPIPMKYEALSC